MKSSVQILKWDCSDAWLYFHYSDELDNAPTNRWNQAKIVDIIQFYSSVKKKCHHRVNILIVSIIQSRKWTRLVHRFWPSYNQFNIVPPIILVIYDRIISTPSGESGLWLIVLILYSYHLSYKNKLRFELKCTISNWYSTNDFRLEESISMLRFSTSRKTKILIIEIDTLCTKINMQKWNLVCK